MSWTSHVYGFGVKIEKGFVVIDKQQKWQIYRTSKSLSAEDWNLVLEKYRTGQSPTATKPPCNCPYAMR